MAKWNFITRMDFMMASWLSAMMTVTFCGRYFIEDVISDASNVYGTVVGDFVTGIIIALFIMMTCFIILAYKSLDIKEQPKRSE
jgi:hypothetical protein